MSASLSAVTSDAEQDVDLVVEQELNDHGRFLRAPRTAQNRAAKIVYGLDELAGQLDRRLPLTWVQALITIADAQNSGHAIVMVQLQEGRADHII